MAPEVGPLFLPEVVWLDDVGSVDDGAEVVLENLEDGLDSCPAGVAPHVDDDGEAELPDILAENREEFKIQSIHYRSISINCILKLQ